MHKKPRNETGGACGSGPWLRQTSTCSLIGVSFNTHGAKYLRFYLVCYCSLPDFCRKRVQRSNQHRWDNKNVGVAFFVWPFVWEVCWLLVEFATHPSTLALKRSPTLRKEDKNLRKLRSANYQFRTLEQHIHVILDELVLKIISSQVLSSWRASRKSNSAASNLTKGSFVFVTEGAFVFLSQCYQSSAPQCAKTVSWCFKIMILLIRESYVHAV